MSARHRGDLQRGARRALLVGSRLADAWRVRPRFTGRRDNHGCREHQSRRNSRDRRVGKLYGGAKVTHWAGIGMLVVAALFVTWALVRPLVVPAETETETGDTPTVAGE